MPNEKVVPETPGQKNQSSSSKPPQDKKLDREAGDAATQAEKTEQRYDKDHDIFRK